MKEQFPRLSEIATQLETSKLMEQKKVDSEEIRKNFIRGVRNLQYTDFKSRQLAELFFGLFFVCAPNKSNQFKDTLRSFCKSYKIQDETPRKPSFLKFDISKGMFFLAKANDFLIQATDSKKDDLLKNTVISTIVEIALHTGVSNVTLRNNVSNLVVSRSDENEQNIRFVRDFISKLNYLVLNNKNYSISTYLECIGQVYQSYNDIFLKTKHGDIILAPEYKRKIFDILKLISNTFYAIGIDSKKDDQMRFQNLTITLEFYKSLSLIKKLRFVVDLFIDYRKIPCRNEFLELAIDELIGKHKLDIKYDYFEQEDLKDILLTIKEFKSEIYDEGYSRSIGTMLDKMILKKLKEKYSEQEIRELGYNK